MFQQMLNASRAVLLRPSVATFEEFERDDLGWALIYTTVAAAIAGLLGAIGSLISRAALQQQLGNLEQQLGDSPALPLIRSMLGGGATVISIFVTFIITIIWFLIFVGVIYLLGRAFGGTGTYGELAFNTSLYSAPLTVIGALLSLIPFVGAMAGLLLWFYQLYLYWLSVQAGMNLPGNKALWVILIPLLVIVIGCCGVFAAIFGLLTIVSSQTSP
jgi:hypothetical protein